MKEYIPNDIIDNIPVWDNHPRPVEGLTPFGYYDNDVEFKRDAPKVAKYVCQKLGYPMVDIELQDVNIYTCFEDAIYTYTSELNKYKISENLLDIKGAPIGTDLTYKQIKTNLGAYIKLAKNYGSEAGSGGNIEYKKGHINITQYKQTYDLNEWAEQNEPGKTIEIKRIYHSEPPTINEYITSEFNWGDMSSSVNFIMLPAIYEDILNIQSIEFNNIIRKSAYTFKLINNQLTLFPYPLTGISVVYFDYIIIEDRDSATYNNDNENTITDYSNVPFKIIEYHRINQSGREWIKKYTIACTKVVLGEIRSKYSSIPIPDAEVSLDGETLRSEGEDMKNALLEELKTMLEKMMKSNQLEQKATEAENLMNVLNNIPMGIYIR